MIESYKVTYKTEVVTKNTIIRPSNYSCIAFENIGEKKALINEVCPLFPNSGNARFYNEKPWVLINSDFTIKSDPSDTTEGNFKVLVTFSFYDKNK